MQIIAGMNPGMNDDGLLGYVHDPLFIYIRDCLLYLGNDLQ